MIQQHRRAARTLRNSLQAFLLTLVFASLAIPLAALTAPDAPPPLNGIAHIAIRVHSIAASTAFYEQLGFEQAFTRTKDGVVTQSCLKINDRQFIELYPVTPKDPTIGFRHLCFEGAEKVLEVLRPQKESLLEKVVELTSAEHEKTMVKGAVRTDFILSTEIMVIALKEVSELSIAMQAVALFAVAIAVTLGVYGIVGLIVKMDDVGLHLATRPPALLQNLGRTLVLGMPKLLSALSTIGIAAMLWVGGQIILHGVHIHPAEWCDLHGGALAWLVDAALSGLFGLTLGGVIALLHHSWTARIN